MPHVLFVFRYVTTRGDGAEIAAYTRYNGRSQLCGPNPRKEAKMTNLTPGVRNAMQCDGISGSSCEGHGAGHELLALQARVTAATPSKWRDALVHSVSSDGWIALDIVETGETTWTWNHRDLTGTLTVGTPVALHGIYHTLAVGTERLNVLVANRIG